MLILSQHDLEIIGESVLSDYAKPTGSEVRTPIDIVNLAQNYLGLEIQYMPLSYNESILGLTTYKGVTLELPLKDGNTLISVPEDRILIEEKLLSGNKMKRIRFTVAHECAHQILARIDEKKTGTSFRQSFSTGKKYTYRELKTAEDWSEWQANTLGAILLMPKSILTRTSTDYMLERMQALFGSSLGKSDNTLVQLMSRQYMVSTHAMKIRMRQLGFVA